VVARAAAGTLRRVTSSDWSAIAVAVIGVLGVAFQARRPRPSLRDKIKADIDLRDALPDSSGAKAKLIQDIERSVQKLIDGEERVGVDLPGMVIGFLTAAAFGWLAWWASSMGTTVRALELFFIPAAALGFFLLVRSSSVVFRDAGGHPILGPDGRRQAPHPSVAFAAFKRPTVKPAAAAPAPAPDAPSAG